MFDEMQSPRITLTWVRRTGVVGGWPVPIKNYWHGYGDGERVCAITPLSNREWILTSHNGSRRSADCDELKRIAEKLVSGGFKG